jgi:hypothetical protein
MKKKTTWIKVSQILVTALPPVVVLCVKFPDFIKSTGTSISAAGVLVAIILACIFRDQTKKLLVDKPSAFKTCLIIFIISLIAVNLGEQCLWISSTALISGACGVPLQMWYNYETKPESTDDILKGIKSLLKSNSSESEDSNNEKT